MLREAMLMNGDNGMRGERVDEVIRHRSPSAKYKCLSEMTSAVRRAARKSQVDQLSRKPQVNKRSVLVLYVRGTVHKEVEPGNCGVRRLAA